MKAEAIFEWAEKYGCDHEWTAATQDKIERMEA